MEKSLSEVMKNIRGRSIKYIPNDEYIVRKKNRTLNKSYFYCRKIKNSPFGKGAMLKEKKPFPNTLYVFAKGYAFYQSKEFGLIKILNFKNTERYSYKIYKLEGNQFGFDESKLVLIEENIKDSK